jgi:uridine kinase
MEDIELKIESVCKKFADFLKAKNHRYVESTTTSMHIFSKSDSSNTIRVKLDDKINKIINSDTLHKEDVISLTGHLIMLMIAEDWTDFSDLKD